MRPSLIIIAAALAFSMLSACEPQPPKPKTDIERQAAPEQPPTKPPEPIIGKKPATKVGFSPSRFRRNPPQADGRLTRFLGVSGHATFAAKHAVAVDSLARRNRDTDWGFNTFDHLAPSNASRVPNIPYALFVGRRSACLG